MESQYRGRNKTITGIDLFKLISSILVVILHTTGPNSTPEQIFFKRNICNIAVPFFFIASGYFFGKGLRKKNRKEYFILYEKRVIKLYIIWSAIGLPFAIHMYYTIYGKNWGYILLLLLRNIFFVGTFGIYWYILSLVCTMPLIYFFDKKNKLKLMYIFSFIFFMLGVIYYGFSSIYSQNIFLNSIAKLVHFIFSSERNFLMTGWFYISIGYYLSNKKIKMNLLLAFLFFIISTILKISEQYLVNINLFNFNIIFKSNELFIFQCLQALFLFIIALKIKVPWLDKYSKVMRELSTTIYYTHFLFIDMIDATLQNNTIYNTLILLFMCSLFYIILKKINNKKLNILINA